MDNQNSENKVEKTDGKLLVDYTQNRSSTQLDYVKVEYDKNELKLEISSSYNTLNLGTISSNDIKLQRDDNQQSYDIQKTYVIQSENNKLNRDATVIKNTESNNSSKNINHKKSAINKDEKNQINPDTTKHAANTSRIPVFTTNSNQIKPESNKHADIVQNQVQKNDNATFNQDVTLTEVDMSLWDKSLYIDYDEIKEEPANIMDAQKSAVIRKKSTMSESLKNNLKKKTENVSKADINRKKSLSLFSGKVRKIEKNGHRAHSMSTREIKIKKSNDALVTINNKQETIAKKTNPLIDGKMQYEYLKFSKSEITIPKDLAHKKTLAALAYLHGGDEVKICKKILPKEPEVKVQRTTSQISLQKPKIIPKSTVDPKKLTLIIAASLFLTLSAAAAVTLVTLYSLKQTSEADYGMLCSTKQCMKAKYLLCINQTCLCNSPLYQWNDTLNTCVETSITSVNHGEICKIGVTVCNNYTSCIDSRCQCDVNTQVWDGTSCIAKKPFSSSCTIRTKSYSGCISDAECFECLNSSNLICNPTTLKCDCQTNYFFDPYSMKCTYTKTYYEYCNSSILCDSSKGLSCKTVDGSPTDNCPTIKNQCDCFSGYFFDILTQMCQKKKSFQKSCISSCECNDTAGFKCYNNMCICPPNTYYNNVTCVSSVSATRSSFLEPCLFNGQCYTELGLYCNSTTLLCNCIYPFYWNTMIGKCIECPDGWVMINLTPNVTRCYYFSTTNVAFSDAWARCVNSEAQLLLIEDSNEWTVLTNYMVPFVAFYHWIGLYYDSYNGGYFWWNGLQTGTWGYYPGNGCGGNPSSYQYFTWYLGSGTSYLCNWYRTYPTRFICKKNF